MNISCFLGWHGWGPWICRERRALMYEGYQIAVLLVQDRECRVCGHRQSREELTDRRAMTVQIIADIRQQVVVSDAPSRQQDK